MVVTYSSSIGLFTNNGMGRILRGNYLADILYGYVMKSLRVRVLGQTALKPLVELTEAALNAISRKVP